jgi:hypothetical protein
MNQDISRSLQNGTLAGKDVDSRIVEMEQTVVQEMLDDFSSNDPAGYDTLISEINAALNPSGVLEIVTQVYGTDKAYGTILDKVRDSLGSDIDFANQSHREAIGNALIDHVRENGGCDLTEMETYSCEK